MTPFEESVGRVLDDLSQGEVVTYGEVAAEAGFPSAHRAVGRFLKNHQGYPSVSYTHLTLPTTPYV